MLILSRKLNESIVIDGRIVVKIVRVDGDIVKVGIDAPADVPVHRWEVYEEIQKNNQEALTNGRPTLLRLPVRNAAAKAARSQPAQEAASQAPEVPLQKT